MALISNKFRVFKKVSLLLLGAVFVLSSQPSTVAALSQEELRSIYNDTVWYKVGQACAPGNLTGSANEEKIFNFFLAKGLSPPQTAGVVGNIMHESSGDPENIENTQGGRSRNPAEADPGGWGLIQWTPGSKILEAAERAGLTGPSWPIYELYTQLELIWKHMHNNPPITKGDFDINYFKTITDYKVATEYFEDKIEGAAIVNLENRQALAFKALQNYGSNTGGFTGGGCAGVPPTTSACASSVYPGQYTEAQLRRIFGPPIRDSRANLVTIDFFGSRIPINKLVAPCLEAVEQELIAKGVSYRPQAIKGGFWCIRERDGQIGDRSYHIYGAACDINPLTNNYFSDGRARPYNPNCPRAPSVIDSGNCYDLPPEYVEAFKRQGFTWGGDFNSVKDYMHLEWHGVIP